MQSNNAGAAIGDSQVWPAFNQEKVAWQPLEMQHVSRRKALEHRGPYLAAVPPKIAEQALILSMGDLASADEAAAELARFDSEVGVMVAPFASILLRSEAASSSQIENLTSSVAAIVRAELGLAETVNSNLIVSNQEAMRAALTASQNLEVETLLNMHRVLLQRFDSANAGVLRTQPVWIGGSSFGPHGADYVAPKYELVPEGLEDLVEFCKRTDLPALVQVALAHAQFESIHPFTDGNGRTGRALVQVLLNRLGLTTSVMVPVSAGLLRNTEQYFEALDSYRAGDPRPIISVFANAALLAVQNGRQLAGELEAVRMRWQSMVTSRKDAGAKLLLDALLAQPLITSKRAVEILQRTPANAQLAIDKLVEVGILSQLGTSKRNRIWQAAEVLEALENFSNRIRR